MKKRALQAIKTRENVYDCALQVIREQGYENTSIKAITAVAGVSIGTFYTYFSSKEHVLLYTYEENEMFYSEAFEKSKDLPFPESLLTFINISYEYIENRGGEILKAILNNLLSDEFKERSTDKTRNFYTSLCSFLKTARDKQQLRPDIDITFYVDQIVTMLNGVELVWCLSDFDKSLNAMAVSSIRVLISGILL